MILAASEVYLKFVAVSTLVMLLASNQAFVTVVLQQLIQYHFFLTEEDGISVPFTKVTPLAIILIFVWVFVPLVKNTRASQLNLITKTIVFIMLVLCSMCFRCLTTHEMNSPPIFPEEISNLDKTFGFLTSYFVLPLLIIAEDRKDYSSEANSASPYNSASSYQLFLKTNAIARFLFGLIFCLSLNSNQTNFIWIDPF